MSYFTTKWFALFVFKRNFFGPFYFFEKFPLNNTLTEVLSGVSAGDQIVTQTIAGSATAVRTTTAAAGGAGCDFASHAALAASASS